MYDALWDGAIHGRALPTKNHRALNFPELQPSMIFVIRRAFLRSLAALPFAAAPLAAVPREGFA
jgi:hypothetical protein